MGTVFQVPWTRMTTWSDAIGALRAADVHVAALALSDGAVHLDEFVRRRPPRVALMLGSEGEGLSPAALSTADSIVTIPMTAGVDSLNVASAAAVALWALRR